MNLYECIIFWDGEGASPLLEQCHPDLGWIATAGYCIAPQPGDHIDCPSYVGCEIACEVVSTRLVPGGEIKVWVKALVLSANDNDEDDDTELPEDAF